MPRAHGRILDSVGNPISGLKVFPYLVRNVSNYQWQTLVNQAGQPVVPATLAHQAVVMTDDQGTPKVAETVRDPDRLGYFDFLGGLPNGLYCLEVVDAAGSKRWAWPFRVVDTGDACDARVGGPGVGVPGGQPDPTLARHFTPGTFTASFSYYGGIGAPLDRVKRDFERFRAAGFQNYRLWVDWPANRCPDSSCFTSKGDVIPALADHLTKILDLGAALGLSADLTMHAAFYEAVKKSEEGYDITCHKDALRALLNRWGKHPAVRVVDVANEGEVRGAGNHGSPDTGHVSPARFADLMGIARAIPRTCLVGISISSGGEKKDVIANAKVMFRDTLPEILLSHWSRVPGWGAAEGPNARKYQAAYPKVPIVFNDEPARNNYQGRSWPASEFEQSFRSAKAAGAHGQCFHYGGCFDLRYKDAWDQLDSVERQVVASLKGWIA